MKLIGLVGGIASGKSFVARQLADLGAQVIDADKLAHQQLGEPEVVELLVQRWGEEIRNADGTVRRDRIAKIVFADTPQGKRELEWLEQQLHPRIHAQVLNLLEQWRSEEMLAVVLDAPVLIKAGWHHQCDEIVFVECSREERLARAAARGWDDAELARREAYQTPVEEKRKLSTFVVQNDGEPQKTRQQLETFWQQRVLT